MSEKNLGKLSDHIILNRINEINGYNNHVNVNNNNINPIPIQYNENQNQENNNIENYIKLMENNNTNNQINPNISNVHSTEFLKYTANRLKNEGEILNNDSIINNLNMNLPEKSVIKPFNFPDKRIEDNKNMPFLTQNQINFPFTDRDMKMNFISSINQNNLKNDFFSTLNIREFDENGINSLRNNNNNNINENYNYVMKNYYPNFDLN